MMVSLRQMALEALRTRVGSGDTLISESIAVQQVLEEKQDPPAGMPSDRLRLKLRVEITAWVVTHASLEQVAVAALSVGLPDGFSPLDETLRIESLSAPEWQAGQAARWEIRADRQIRANWNADAVIRSVAGSQPGAAAQRLSADFRLRKAPTIELNPSWWVRLPILPFRIEVVAE
jgi:glutathione S-transferase